MVRRWSRGSLQGIGVACLVGGTVALIDGHPGVAGAGAGIGLAWVLVGRLLWPH